MKLVKSLLLGSAAGLVAVAGASAADLGVKKPSAVEYVKTCPTYGAGFFVVPGTTSCLKLIGRVRADYLFANSNVQTRVGGLFGANATTNANAYRIRGYIGFDHRTATEYGLLRTFVRAYFQHQDGGTNPGSSSPDRGNLEYAFIQFGGLTAGRAAPAFEHGWNQFYFGSGQGTGGGYHADASYTNTLGYTFNAGGGFSATVALDDPRERRSVGSAGFAGAMLPDLVGSLAYDQTWGSLKLSGALTQNRAANAVADTVYGYAVEGGVKINLPFLTKGSNFWVSGSYARGATNYTGHSTLSATTVGGFLYTGAALQGLDAVTVGTTQKLAVSFATMAALQVFVTPTVAVSVAGTYSSFNPFGSNNSFKVASVWGQLQWSPVAGFIIGSEVGYRHISIDSAALVGGGAYITNTKNTVNPLLNKKSSDIVGRLRFQRDF
jgi:Porin subfamily